MDSNDFALTQSILDQIDVIELIDRIGFATEKKRILGKTLKTPCMIHKDASFASLIIDLEKNTYKCMKSSCSAHHGGNMLDLYCLYSGKSGMAASFALADFLGFSLDDSAAEEIFESHLASAYQAVEKGDLETLRLEIRNIEEIRKNFQGLSYLKAESEALKPDADPETCQILWKQAIVDLSHQQNDQKALELFESKLSAHNILDEDFLDLIADLYSRSGNQAEQIKIIQSMIEASSDVNRKLQLFIKFPQKYFADNPAQLVDFATCYQLINDPKKAEELFLLAGKIAQEKDLPELQLEVYESLFCIDQQNEVYLDSLIDLALKLEEQSRVAEFLKKQSEQLLAEEQFEAVLNPIKKCLQLDASDPEKWELASTLYERLDDPKGSCDALLNCIGLMKDQDYPEARIKEKFEFCLKQLGDDYELLDKAAHVCHQIGYESQAQELLTQGISLAEKNQNPEKLLAWLNLGLEWNSSNIDLHEQRLDLLKITHQLESWKSNALELVTLYEQNDDFGKSLQLISELTERFPDDSNVRVLWLKHQIGEGSSIEEELGSECNQLLATARLNQDRALALSIMGTVKGTIAETAECRQQYAQLIHDSLVREEDVSSEELRFALRSTFVPAEVLLAAVYSDVCQSDRDQTNLIIRTGRQAIEENHEECAGAVYDLLKKADGVTFELLMLEAELSKFMGNTEQNIEDLKRLSEYCVAEGKTKEAINSILRLLNYEEHNVELIEKLSQLYRDIDREDKFVEFQIRLANAHKVLGDSKKAEEILAACQKTNPDNIFVIRELAKSLAQNGKKAESIDLFLKVASILEEEDQVAEALQTHIEILLQDKSHKESKHHYLRLVAENQKLSKIDIATVAEYLASEYDQLNPQIRIQLLDFLNLKKKLLPDFTEHLLQDIESYPDIFSNSQLLDFGQFVCTHLDAVAAAPFYKCLSQNPDVSIESLDKCFNVAQDSKEPELIKSISISLANKLQVENQVSSAIKVLEDLNDEYRDHDIIHQLIELYVLSGEKNKAYKLYTQLIENQLQQNNFKEAKEDIHNLSLSAEHLPAIQEQCAKFSLSIDDQESAVNYYRVAVDLYQEDEPELAVDVIDQILDLDTDKVIWLWKKSALLQDLDQFEAAVSSLKEIVSISDSEEVKIEAFSQLIALAPKDTDARLELARLLRETDQQSKSSEHYQILIQSYLKTNQFQEAEKVLEEALEHLETQIDIQLSRVDVLEKINKLEEHLPDIYQKILEINDHGASESAELLLEKIRPFANQQDELFLRCLTQVGSEESKNEAVANVKYRLCQVMVKEGRVQEAILELKEAISSGTDTAVLRQELARLYTQTGAMEEARNEYLTLIRYQTDRGHIDQARRFVPSLISMDADNIHLREQIASIFLKNGIPEIASEQYLEIAKVVKEEKNTSEAIRWTQRALESTPRLIDARIFLARLFEETEEKQKATAQYVKAAELLIDSGAFTRGAELLERICRMMPESPEPREQLAKLFEQRGDIPRYIEQLEKLSKLYASLNRDDERLDIHKRLIASKPDDTRLRRSYIDFLKSKGNNEETFQNLMLLAKHFEKKGFWKDAISNYRQALNFSHDKKTVFLGLLELLENHATPEEYAREAIKYIEVLLEDGSIPEAQMLLNSISNAAKDMPEFHMAKGSLLTATSQTGQALIALSEAKKLLENKGSFELKQVLLERLLKLDPTNISARRELIKLLQEHHKIEEATQNLWELANHYIEEDLIDLALAELRTLTNIIPDDLKVWETYFQCQEKAGITEVNLDDMMRYSDLLLESGKIIESLDTLSKVIKSDPFHISARIQYTRNYLKVGPEQDLVEDYLTLADLLVSVQRIDDALFFYDKVVTLDPDHRDAQLRMTQTQRKKRGDHISPKEITDPSIIRPHESTRFRSRSSIDKNSGTNSAMAFLQNELTAYDEEDETEELRQVVDNYLEILDINPHNAIVRLKLTDLFLQLDDQESALSQLIQASEIFATKGEIKQCIETCERILEIRPNDQRARLRLKQAINKRDAFKALESAIIYADHSEESSGE